MANIISVGSLRTRLSNLAIGSNAYDALYEDSMLRIGFQGPELEHIAVQMLLVLTCARRPLSPPELSHALSIDESSDAFDEDMIPDMDDLVAACTGLAVLDDTSNIVHLVHKSAAEYFERTRSRWFPRANEKMAFMCLKYLQIAEAKPEEARDGEAPFFHYAKANWCYHSMESEKEAANETAMSNASLTGSASDGSSLPNRLAVTQLSIQQMTKEVVDVDSSIVEACHAGHQAWVEQLLVVRNYDANVHGKFIHDKKPIRNHASTKHGVTGAAFKDNVLLTIAAARGDYSMTQMLLARGADPNVFNDMGETPLAIAVVNGFDELVSLLLDQKSIDPDLAFWHCNVLSTAFLVSIELGREGCFRPLLERSNRRARDSRRRGAIWLAAAFGHIGIISELLKWPDVEIDYTDTGSCGNPIAAAIRAGHEEAALLLLPYSKCRSCEYCGATPIHYAVSKGCHDILKRLLEHDSSTVDNELHIRSNAKSNPDWHFVMGCEQQGTEYRKTPLKIAISLQDAQGTRILLPYADVNQGFTRRPLHYAAECGNFEIFELLLKQANIEPDPVDEHGRTPFLLAAERGDYDIMNALIQKGGIQLDIRNEYGKTPFFLMAERGNCDMMNALIRLRDVQSVGRDVLGCVVDHYIFNHFPNIHVDCFEALASILDADVNRKDPMGSTFLHRVCSLRPKISIKEDMGMRIFEAELLEANSGPLVAELLKRPNIDVNLLDEEGNTPLLLAVKNHQRDVVRILLERDDIDVLVQDERGRDALLLASVYESMFRQLFFKNASSMKAEIRPLRGQVPILYRVDHWPEVLDAEFREYDESIFGMLLHDKRTYLHHKQDEWDGIMWRVAVAGTKSMVQAVLEVTELASELELLSYEDRSLISYALERNEDDEAVELLIAHCSSDILQKADAEGRTPLSYAVQRATSQATQSLLKAGMNTCTKVADQFGATPLSYAVKEGHANMIRLLIAADETLINTPDCNGLTPLMQASRRLNFLAMSIFLESLNVDILALDGEGHSFLCYLIKALCSNINRDELEDEIDGVIHRIHLLLQAHIRAIEAFIHSPFLCALEKHEKQYPRPSDASGAGKETKKEIIRFMNNLQRYTNLSDLFHPGLDFSRCVNIAGLLEMLGEKEHVAYHYNVYEERSLHIRALRPHGGKKKT